MLFSLIASFLVDRHIALRLWLHARPITRPSQTALSIAWFAAFHRQRPSASRSPPIMFTLFIFYEALTLSTYPLGHAYAATDGSAARPAASISACCSATSIGLLLVRRDPGPGRLPQARWTSRRAAYWPARCLAGGDRRLLFALYVFGIGKAALMPFHRWLPAAMVAPTPVSALLHAVAVVKAGVSSASSRLRSTCSASRIWLDETGVEALDPLRRRRDAHPNRRWWRCAQPRQPQGCGSPTPR